jgi:beta-galactosidase
MLRADRTRLSADGADLAMVRVEVCDAQGNPVPTANTPLRFGLTGAARLIGLGNGDPTSTEPDKGTTRRALNALALAIVQSDGRQGAARLVVTAQGMPDAAIDLFFHTGA